ncbi:hypothetical protein TIFTF001_006605 [Ficus carica]|uniref:K Homology domain-containing protein n=1 Tax=Ficus carica TaxID=3494 RepID=A0AA88DFU7_FICCA|nr:hypothetical protein TIFTF001_006605 [Ficus carica]
MIACRSLFRVDRVLKLTNSCNALKPIGYFQGYGAYHVLNHKVKMGGGKDKQSAGKQGKKLKAINPVWRPVSTQASSYEECSIMDVEVESGAEIQVQEVHSSTSTSISNAQIVTELTEEVSEITDPITSSSGLDGSGEDRVLKGKSVVSAEKHSISVGASLFRFIRGKGGATQKKIEEEMGVNIVFPSLKKEDSVIIEGVSIDSVSQASASIQAIIDQAVKSPNLEYSHFISLPLAIHPELVEKLFMFQNSILGCSSDHHREENMVSDTNEDSTENEDEVQKLEKGPGVAVKLNVDDDKERVNVNITNVPLVSYAPKASKSSYISGMKLVILCDATAPQQLQYLFDSLKKERFELRVDDLMFVPCNMLVLFAPGAMGLNMGIEKSIFPNPKTFHLTVLMLKLWNKERVNAAAEVLQSISSQVIDALDNRPVSVRLRGLDCMRGSLAKARVVYLPVEEIGGEGRLLLACPFLEVIIDAFVKAGLVLEKDANHSLKLHATVMNARHRKRTKWTRNADSFDARTIFKQYGSEDWGDYVIHEAHLSQRFAYDDNGYYHCCASIPFPVNMQAD